MVVLAVGAHPDDIEFGCFGTLARLAKREPIRFLLFTSGEIGGEPRTRRAEARKAAGLIGADINVLKHRDGYLEVNAETIGQLRRSIASSGASTIFCPHYSDVHQDHRAAGRIAMACWKKVDRLFFYEGPTSLDFNPNVFSDVSPYFGMKEKALNCFNSQKHKPLMDVAQVKGIAQHRAWECGRSGALFEGFVLFRSVNGIL